MTEPTYLLTSYNTTAPEAFRFWQLTASEAARLFVRVEGGDLDLHGRQACAA
jgi:hypothetical protein